MVKFFARRLILAALVMLTVLTISFALTRLSGDLAISIAGPQATQQDITTIRKAYGLDRPLVVQFASWVASAAQGDLGRSYIFHEQASKLIGERLPVTLRLGIGGLIVALVISLPLGILAATREGGPVDRAVMMVAVVGQAMPTFWLGLVLIVIFGLKLGWLPVSGADSWRGFVMPCFVLGFAVVPSLMRLTRSGMIDALNSDYIRTARAKGLSRASVVLKHAFRNAAMPVVSVAAVQLGFVLGGSVVIESVFALPGVGYLGWESITKSDFPVVQAVVLFLSVIFIVLTLVADLVNALLDPRLRSS